MRTLPAATALLVTSIFLLAGCAGSSPTPTGTGKQVEMKETEFQPANLTVAKGTTVTWINRDSFYHTVTSDDATSAEKLESPNVNAGKAYTHTFETPGTYTYHCKPHSDVKDGKRTGMTGTIVVTA